MNSEQKTATGPFPGQFSRALHLFALVQVAIAYPVYGLLSHFPEFFVARQSQPSDIVFLVLAFSVGLPAALFGLQAVAARISASLGRTIFLLLIAILFLFLGLSLAHNFLEGQAQLVFGTVFCLLLTGAYWLSSIGRLFVTFLWPAIFVVPLMFLIHANVAPLLQPAEVISPVELSTTPATTPVIFIVFDELPTFALLDDAGGIDAGRFPNFHALAGSSYWYPNATTVATSTILAVPPILTGRYPADFVMPHHGEFPDNLFTWLGHDYDLNVHEAVSVMCPESLCGSGRLPPAGARIHDLLLDVSAIYLNVITPDQLRSYLPVVTQSWEGFWGGMQRADRMYEHRLKQLEDFTGQIQASGKPGLDFMHVNLPHIPYEYLPSGKRYQDGWQMPGLDVPSDSWTGTEWQSAQAYHRFLLQLGALDGWLGKLVSKLKSENLFDRTLIVITADHGVSFTPGSSRRDAPPLENLVRNILPVPLIIKAPNQQRGQVSERNAETIDIVPTLADLLGRPVTWDVDGVSLLGDPKPPGKRAMHSYKDLKVYVTDVENVAEGLRQARKNGPFAASEGGSLERRMERYQKWIGDAVASHPVQQNQYLQIHIDHAAYFENVAPASGFLPAHVSGSIDWPGQEGVDLVVALNGHIGAVTSAYAGDSGWRFSAMLPEAIFRPGENELQILAIDAGDSGQFALIAGSAGIGGENYGWNAEAGALEYAGSRLIIDPDGIDGAVDYISLGEESVEILGWAIDSAHSRAVKAILVFDSSRLVYQGRTPMLREETHQFGVVIEVGFLAVIPFAQMQDRTGSGLRVFAVTEDDRALEMIWK